MAEWYVVGGAVRDLLLGRPVHDLDISFSGSTESFVQCFPQARNTGNSSREIWTVGAMEFTPLQGDVCRDMLRRDITVNAAAFDSRGMFYCHPEFYRDAAEKTFRLAAPESLKQDPLRVFRVARFAAEMPEFSPAEETLDAMQQLSHHDISCIAALPRERIAREVMRVLDAPQPSRFFEVLFQADCLSPWFEELTPAADIPAGPAPWHDNSVFEHTLEVMDRCAGHAAAVWMALCHDLGKIHTASNVLPHHYGHEKRGVELARNLGRRLGMPSRYIRAGAVGTAQHMKGGMYGTLRSGTRRDMLIQIYQTGIFHDFWVLAGADGGWNWEPQAKRDLTAILRVQLPLEWQNRGAASGKHLRELQCEVLSHLPGMDPLRADNAPQFYAEHGEIY